MFLDEAFNRIDLLAYLCLQTSVTQGWLRLYRLIFSLFNVVDVPFHQQQQQLYHGVLLCVPFFSSLYRIHCRWRFAVDVYCSYCYGVKLEDWIAEVLFFACNAMWWVWHGWYQNIMALTYQDSGHTFHKWVFHIFCNMAWWIAEMLLCCSLLMFCCETGQTYTWLQSMLAYGLWLRHMLTILLLEWYAWINHSYNYYNFNKS